MGLWGLRGSGTRRAGWRLACLAGGNSGSSLRAANPQQLAQSLAPCARPPPPPRSVVAHLDVLLRCRLAELRHGRLGQRVAQQVLGAEHHQRLAELRGGRGASRALARRRACQACPATQRQPRGCAVGGPSSLPGGPPVGAAYLAVQLAAQHVEVVGRGGTVHDLRARAQAGGVEWGRRPVGQVGRAQRSNNRGARGASPRCHVRATSPRRAVWLLPAPCGCEPCRLLAPSTGRRVRRQRGEAPRPTCQLHDWIWEPRCPPTNHLLSSMVGSW